MLLLLRGPLCVTLLLAPLRLRGPPCEAPLLVLLLLRGPPLSHGFRRKGAIFRRGRLLRRGRGSWCGWRRKRDCPTVRLRPWDVCRLRRHSRSKFRRPWSHWRRICRQRRPLLPRCCWHCGGHLCHFAQNICGTLNLLGQAMDFGHPTAARALLQVHLKAGPGNGLGLRGEQFWRQCRASTPTLKLAAESHLHAVALRMQLPDKLLGDSHLVCGARDADPRVGPVHDDGNLRLVLHAVEVTVTAAPVQEQHSPDRLRNVNPLHAQVLHEFSGGRNRRRRATQLDSLSKRVEGATRAGPALHLQHTSLAAL
mmetsp:Transcript_17165/g.46793  ORF Transcript_17165/g.46793 Transcript_17165/m.46793 type:complete len:310 (-) Transcript_17165:1173-2102(-)